MTVEILETCPKCGTSLVGEPVPEESRVHRDDCPGGRCFCFPYGLETTHFSRVIGHEVGTVYDGVLFWICPDCRGTWPRFTTGRLAEESKYWAWVAEELG